MFLGILDSNCWYVIYSVFLLVCYLSFHFNNTNSVIYLQNFYIFLFFLIFIYVAVRVLSCDTRDLQSSSQHVGSFFLNCGI